MYWPFAGSKAVYAAIGFLFVFNVLLDPHQKYSVLSVDWGYLLVALASLASGAGSLASFATNRGWCGSGAAPAAAEGATPQAAGVQMASWPEQAPSGSSASGS